MAGMRVDLEGLFNNVIACVPRGEHREYYGFCLNEVLQHLKETAKGEHTIAEFAEHYCLLRDTKPKK